jgi:lipoprotein-anchoring transpeptidase ErfK/SrfK
MRFARPSSRSAAIALSSLVVLVVAGVVLLLVGRGSTPSNASTVSSPHQPAPAARLSVAHLHHKTLPFTQHLRLHVKHGLLSSVAVTQTGGQPVAGSFNTTHSVWQSTHTFVPLTKLTTAVSYVNADNHKTTSTMHLSTTDSKEHVNALLSPGEGDTVGVGSPVVVTFDQPIPTSKRAAVEKRLSVTSTPSVVGAWHWMSAQEVHWRPPTYWKTGTKVKVASYLQGLSLGHGVWGAPGHHSTTFRIGDAHISEADIATDQMKVYNNGTLIKTFPFSGGATQWPTKNGVHIAIEKSPTVTMDSATVGIPKGSPGYYNETVFWDVRISDGGEFVHAAPWSVGSQGRANVSHGCTGMSTANAAWLYQRSMVGDVVQYTGTSRPTDLTNGFGDWNLPFRDYRAGSAL